MDFREKYYRVRFKQKEINELRFLGRMESHYDGEGFSRLYNRTAYINIIIILPPHVRPVIVIVINVHQ